MPIDPHSTLSQYKNKRNPKTGPRPSVRFVMDPLSPNSPLSRKEPVSPSADAAFKNRPIATNSRIKQDEKFKKDMHLAYINNAFMQRSMGNSQLFDDLVSQFNFKSDDTATSPAQLRLSLLALSHVVSRLDNQYSTLVEAVVNMPWITMDNAFVRTYTSFVGILISARPEYLGLILSMVCEAFTHQYSLQVVSADRPEDLSQITRRVAYDRVHGLLAHILTLIPTLPQTLFPLLCKAFPHKRQPSVSQTTFIRNLLRVTEYCPALSEKILGTIVDRAIQIDVEIQVEIEELEELDGGAPEIGEVFELDPFDGVIGQDGDESDDDADLSDIENERLSDISSDRDDIDADTLEGPKALNTKHIRDMVSKLDAILSLIFKHFQSQLDIQTPLSVIVESSRALPQSPALEFPSPARSPDHLRIQFHTLLSIFDRTILSTYKSRYTQFLLFFFTSLSPEFADVFTGLLVSRALLEPDASSVSRIAAAGYVASYISRATFIDEAAVRTVVRVLCRYISTYLDAYDVSGELLSGDKDRGVWYAICQAIFLIFCFRWRNLQEESEGDDALGEHSAFAGKWMGDLAVIQRAVSSSLNPLKICSPNVVKQFARVAQATHFVYCFSIIKANDRASALQNGTSSSDASGTLIESNNRGELSSFFPFDPFRLPRSHEFIDPLYREWASVATDEGDEDESDESSDEENDSENESNSSDNGSDLEDIPLPSTTRVGIPGSNLREGSPGAELGQSFGIMSISPIPHAIPIA